jgi:predicted nucleotidyltransferase
VDKEIRSVVDKYKRSLETLGIRVKRIILYGSYASGNAKNESDIDLLVVSDDFERMDLWKRLALLGRARMGIKRPMEIIGFTEEEFKAEQRGSFVGDEIKTKGVEVK